MFAFDELLNTALAAVTNGPEYVAFRAHLHYSPMRIEG